MPQVNCAPSRHPAYQSVAKLFYNRAYHADLVSEATTLAGLIAYSNNNSSVHFEAYRLYMAFLEQMAKIWYPDSAARVSFLNREYDRPVEIDGLRLRGYDHVADYLERSFITPWQINGSGRIKGNRLGD